MVGKLGVLGVVGVLALAVPAGAQDAVDPQPDAPAEDTVEPQQEAAAEDAVDPADAQAREVFRRGAAAFGEGRYEDALAAFEEAYRLSGRAVLHFNLALAHDRLRQDRQALEAYERYLAEVEDIPNRAEVERRVEILRRATADETPPQGETPEAGQSAEAPGGRSSEPGVLPWIVLGASGAVAVGGGILFAVGLGDSGSVEDAPDGASWSEYERAAHRGGLLQTLGVIGLAAGLAGMAAGVTLLMLGGDEEAPIAAHLSPQGLAVRGTF